MTPTGSVAPSLDGEAPAVAGTTTGNRITLADHTVTQEADENGLGEARTAESTSQAATGHPPLERNVTWKLGQLSTQQGRTARRYARYQEGNFVERNDQSADGPQATKGRRERAQTKVRGLLHVKKLKQSQEEDAVIEVLYENQRGFFAFGIPHFASRSLLNFDPKPWTNAERRTSPVDIHNAQVPDPNWEWAWKSWYVDMSRDVDEDGWEYSWAFKGTAWHGNHPWFHSWVRRRRWLRKRVRKIAHHGAGAQAGQRHMSDAHMLTPDYFTIHTGKQRNPSRTGSIATSGSAWAKGPTQEDLETEMAEVHDIGSLLRLMKKSSIDRQKVVLVRTFLANADDELAYLSDEIPHIMSIMVFQNSRKIVLQLLVDELDRATAHRRDHQAQEKEEGEKEGRRIDNLLKASKAAEDEVKKLEFWSDIRGLVRDGKTVGGTDGTSWDCDEWAGLDGSGAQDLGADAKQPGQEQDEED